MKVLLVHQNFPGQFVRVLPALANDPQNEVVVFTMNDYRTTLPRVRVVRNVPERGTTPNIHPWVADFETKVIRGETTFRTAIKLKESGFVPDVIYAHPGWGESLFLKEVWPEAKLLVYSEFYYDVHGRDTGFDPEFPSLDPEGDACRLRLKNLNALLHFQVADRGISPTRWQADTFPEPYRSRIHVIHDGIDTDLARPNLDVWMQIGSHRLTRADEVITFVNRNLEPYRGYHIFMRALPKILSSRPNAKVVIVGGDKVSYGAAPQEGKSWKDIFLQEVKDQIDLDRVLFVGNIKYQDFIPLLQLSTVHVYLTYPFVLSWSLLEAMSCGCAIVASDTAPLREAIIHDQTGLLVDFFDVDALAEKTVYLLEHPEERARLGQAARRFALEHYDVKSVCLPQILDCIYQAAGQEKPEVLA